MDNNEAKLTAHERDAILPLVIQILKHRETKQKVFSNTKIRIVLKEFGEEITEPQIKRIVFHIRNNGLVDLLLANSEGYFVAENIKDVEEWMKMQKGKIEAMTQTLANIDKQYRFNIDKLVHGKKSALMGQMTIFMFDD